MNSIILVIILVIVLITMVIMSYYMLSKKGFFAVSIIQPYLKNISHIRHDIIEEISLLNKTKWIEWPEKDLYKGDLKWHIIPICGFGVWISKIENSCPRLCKFLKNVPGLKLAIISKLAPMTELIPHRGWGKHSNNVLRCHYGLDVPKDCFVTVNGEKQYHENDKWIIFDDSKEHSASNNSGKDRIVLILDIERPLWIPKGNSKVEFSQELQNVIDKFKNDKI
jgi:hypothetical protein